jgi:hypothetical protein
MRWRKQRRKPTSPNFLFSTWPLVEWGEVPTVVVEPSDDDRKQIQAAIDRLSAIGGGEVRLTAGDFYPSGSIYFP